MSNEVRQRPRRAAVAPKEEKKRRPVRRRKTGKKVRTRFAFGKVFGRTFFRRLLISIGVAVFISLVLMAFLRVRNISVVGNSVYSQSEIQEASGISQGSALLLVNKTTAASRIQAQLPYIDEVRVGINLPDTVKIEVVELETAFAVAADDGSYWLINAEGRLIEQITAKAASDYLKIDGVRIKSTAVGDQAVATEASAEPPPDEEEAQTGENAEEEESEESEESEGPPEAPAAQRLDVALQIVRQLAEGEEIREITSVDVSSIYDLQIWYGTRFQVKLGGVSELGYKLDYMLAAISQLESYQSGVLDLTFQEAKKATFIPWSS